MSMKRKLPPNLPFVNMLHDLHNQLFNCPIEFRDRVCEECSWSIPTFYRKMKAIDRTTSGKGKLVPALSNAEREKIIAVFDEVYETMWEYCSKYRKPR
ncbi:hypothetical protein CK934_05890 [Chitinophaga sp. MD30]|nr:hypothetical protein CK934_05890 [Chitinophaga sp. MD30]